MEILGLKKSNCKNCYKCIRECPVKSIQFEDHQAHILAYECILCGRCMVACPQNAKIVRNDTQIVKDAILAGKKVVASVAPSFIVDFDVADISEFETTLKLLGFSQAQETAEGAYLVKSEYEAIVREKKQEVVITTCCSSVVTLVQKYYPTAIPYLAKVLSPVLAHGKYIKENDPDAFVVFIGPCISKKEEAEKYPGFVDCVLTFDDIRDWTQKEQIELSPQTKKINAGYTSRFFPQTGGILKTMDRENTGYHYLAVDGVERCKQALENIENGHLSGYFIEMSACKGSCINGPLVHSYRDKMLESEIKLEDYARPNLNDIRDYDIRIDFDLSKNIHEDTILKPRPGEKTIKEILAKMGKTKPEDELNCGTCGYSTCREKAIAVYNKKADVTMCLPYMKERAESFSDQIIHITPNAIIVLDNTLKIQQLNVSACQLFHIKGGKSMIGSPIMDLMDPTDFVQVLNGAPTINDKKCYLAEYDKYVEMSIVYEKQNDMVIGIMKDITQEEKEREKHKEIRDKTIDITDKVIDKQMRIVQEIASLLGETTAETKIALTKLKNTVYEENQKP